MYVNFSRGKFYKWTVRVNVWNQQLNFKKTLGMKVYIERSHVWGYKSTLSNHFYKIPTGHLKQETKSERLGTSSNNIYSF